MFLKTYKGEGYEKGDHYIINSLILVFFLGCLRSSGFHVFQHDAMVEFAPPLHHLENLMAKIHNDTLFVKFVCCMAGWKEVRGAVLCAAPCCPGYVEKVGRDILTAAG